MVYNNQARHMKVACFFICGDLQDLASATYNEEKG